MQRLLQGDVGSGKTVVALYALLRAVEDGRQGALMAPTETLAEQHFLTIEGICTELGIRVVLLTGSAGSAKARAAIESGEAEIVVGHIWRSDFPEAPRLKLLQAATAGVDMIDLPSLPRGKASGFSSLSPDCHCRTTSYSVGGSGDVAPRRCILK